MGGAERNVTFPYGSNAIQWDPMGDIIFYVCLFGVVLYFGEERDKRVQARQALKGCKRPVYGEHTSRG